MRASLLVFVALAVASANAQQQVLQTSGGDTKSAAVSSASTNRLLSLLPEGTPTNQDSIAIGKELRLGGPAVKVFKTRKVLDVPRRILNVLNPFTPSERAEVSFTPTRNLNPRAWATTVGFHPGGSAFADATTHEPTMTLLSVGR